MLETKVETQAKFAACLKRAAHQNGVLSRAQAREEGLTNGQISRRCSWGQWSRLLPGVYCVGPPKKTLRGRARAALLWAGEKAVLSHGTAAAIYGFTRFEDFDGPIDLITPEMLRVRPEVLPRQIDLAKRDKATWSGFDITTRPRTVLDLCAVAERKDARSALEESLVIWGAEIEVFNSVAHRSKGVPGIAVFRDLLLPYCVGESPTKSHFEGVVRDVLEFHGFPRPICQEPIMVGGRVFQMDFRFPDLPLVLEVDGFAFHASPSALVHDHERSNLLVEAGLHIIRWNWWTVRSNPELLVRQLWRVIEALRAKANSTR